MLKWLERGSTARLEYATKAYCNWHAGFVAGSATSLPSELGICGQSLRQAVSSMSLAAERAMWQWQCGGSIEGADSRTDS